MSPAPPFCAAAQPSGRDDAAWVMVLTTLGAIFLLQMLDSFSLSSDGLAVPAAFAAILGMVAAFYRRYRSAPAIVAMTVALQQMTLFSALGAILSYMMAARGGAPWDGRIAGWDAALGFDWPAALHWLDRHALLAAPLKAAYETLMPQMAALVVALGVGGRLAALRTAVLAAMLSGLAAILLSAVMPAMGAYMHFGVQPGDYPHLWPATALVHVHDLQGLRDGALRTLSLATMQGIITFPSYHAALATIFGWGFSRASRRWIGWPGMAVAGLTLLSTPLDGGHYLSDVLAGCAIASISLWIASRAIHLDLAGTKALAPMSAVLEPEAVGLRS
ncbi:MAG: phosphatase PAP2 family protein [Sphingobium sp.]|nr:phosphatase PAP2 family protein [Sphingobium sp.]